MDDLSGGDARNLSGFLADSDQSQCVEGHAPIELVQGCIRNADSVREGMDGCQHVFHLAALGSVPRSITMPAVYTDVNIVGTMNVLEIARELRVKRLMFASSSSVYGETPTLPKREDMPMLALSPYAASKISGEALVRAYAKCYDIDTVCLRYFNVFGPRQNANSAYAAVIAAFGKALAAGSAPKIFDDGEQSRDFTFVENVVHANLLAARAATHLNGTAINIACGRRITVNQLAREMMQAYGLADLSIEYVTARKGDIRHSLAALDRAKEILGYEAIVDFEVGLRHTIKSMQEAI